MLLAGIDIETTGLLTPDHRIIEIYIGLWRDNKKIWQYEQRINPERAISTDAQKMHGISVHDLFGQPKWGEVAPTIQGILDKADVYVAHNGQKFDIPFIKKELERVGLQMPEKPILDTMLDAIWATSDGKKPKLSELAFACGVDYNPALAHVASYDVEIMMACLLKARTWGYFALPDVGKDGEGFLTAA